MPLTASRQPSRSGLLERRAGLVEAIERAQRQGRAAERVGIVRPGEAGAAIGGERFLGPAEFQQRRAEIERRLGEIRPPAKRFAGRLGGLVEPAELSQRAGAAVTDIGVVGNGRLRGIERGQGVLETVQLKQQLAHVRPCGRQIGFAIHGASIEAQRRFGLAPPAEDIAAHAERLGEVVLLAQRRVERVGRFLLAPRAPERDGVRIMSRRAADRGCAVEDWLGVHALSGEGRRVARRSDRCDRPSLREPYAPFWPQSAPGSRRQGIAQAWCKLAGSGSPQDVSEGSRVSQVYLFELASHRTQWLSSRQELIAGNVANANTPAVSRPGSKTFLRGARPDAIHDGDDQSRPYHAAGDRARRRASDRQRWPPIPRYRAIP